MKKSTWPVMILSVLLVVGVAILLFGSSPDTDEPQSSQEASSQLNPNQTSYLDYRANLLQQADDKRVVLFFNASWCPTCRIADKNFTTQARSGSFPDDLIILNVDYDDHQALRQQYGVTGQHTYVQVDAQGQALKAWGGSLTLNQIIEQAEPL